MKLFERLVKSQWKKSAVNQDKFLPLKLIEVEAIKFNFWIFCVSNAAGICKACSLKRNVSTQPICHCTLNENWYFNINLITRILSDILTASEALSLQLQASRIKLNFIGSILSFGNVVFIVESGWEWKKHREMKFKAVTRSCGIWMKFFTQKSKAEKRNQTEIDDFFLWTWVCLSVI